MGSFLTGLFEQSAGIPFLSAFLLGLMTAISPCPLATNITAIGYIGKDLTNRNRVFINGIIYTAGRALAYTLLAMIIFFGADQFSVSAVFQRYGEKILGPLLLLVGVIMLDVIPIRFSGSGRLGARLSEKSAMGYMDVLLLGVVFALAFCPYSGILYFGTLIPLTISSPAGLALPVVFALATGIPVVIFAWLLAYTASGVGKLYAGVKNFEKWFRRVIAGVFIMVGVYYIHIIYIKVLLH